MIKMFDKNGDGKLDQEERAQLKAYMTERRMKRMQNEGQGGGGFGAGGQSPQ
jgi:hypothetical protein